MVTFMHISRPNVSSISTVKFSPIIQGQLITPTSMFQENFAIASAEAFITLVTGLG